MNTPRHRSRRISAERIYTLLRTLCYFSLLASHFSLYSCADQDLVQQETHSGDPIQLRAEIQQQHVTRASDGGFADGDEIGVFVVNYDNDQPQPLLPTGNHADNVRFTYDEAAAKWTGSYQLYWKDKKTPIDAYGYYPFDAELTSTQTYPFSVQRNQRDVLKTGRQLSGYEQSDFLWAKKENVRPTAGLINLQHHHILAGIKVILHEGQGFDEGEWDDIQKSVLIENTILNSTINLQTGTATPAGSTTQPITPIPAGSAPGGSTDQSSTAYRAIVVPQTVAAGKELIQVLIDGQAYGLTKTEPMTFLPGKMHQFTVTIDRSTATGDFTCTLEDEAILPWIDDPEFHEGLVHQYVWVDVDEPGTLGAKLRQQVADVTKVNNLKVTGTINWDDQYFMWNEVTSLQRLNLQKAVIDDGVLNGPYIGQDIARHHPLEKIIYPEKGLTEIGGFIGTSLNGSLIIPEGVERLGWHAFSANPLNGTLSLPSTLKYNDATCEYNGILHGEFRMPEMYLPPTLKKINGPLPSGLTGTINIPQGCEISQFVFQESQCTRLILPEGMTDIPIGAFRWSKIAGEVILPSTVTHIGGAAFQNTNITKVIFPFAYSQEYIHFVGKVFCRMCLHWLYSMPR